MKKALKIFKSLPMWAFGVGFSALCVLGICEAIIRIMPEATKAWRIANFMSPIASRLVTAGGRVCFASFAIYLLLIVVDEITK